jgi:hypothetical protein
MGGARSSGEAPARRGGGGRSRGNALLFASSRPAGREANQQANWWLAVAAHQGSVSEMNSQLGGSLRCCRTVPRGGRGPLFHHHQANDNYGAIALMCGRSAKLDSLVPGGSESQLNVRKCSNSRLKARDGRPPPPRRVRRRDRGRQGLRQHGGALRLPVRHCSLLLQVLPARGLADAQERVQGDPERRVQGAQE